MTVPLGVPLKIYELMPGAPSQARGPLCSLYEFHAMATAMSVAVPGINGLKGTEWQSTASSFNEIIESCEDRDFAMFDQYMNVCASTSQFRRGLQERAAEIPELAQSAKADNRDWTHDPENYGTDAGLFIKVALLAGVEFNAENGRFFRPHFEMFIHLLEDLLQGDRERQSSGPIRRWLDRRRMNRVLENAPPYCKNYSTDLACDAIKVLRKLAGLCGDAAEQNRHFTFRLPDDQIVKRVRIGMTEECILRDGSSMRISVNEG